LFTYGGALSVGTLVIGTAPAGYGYTMDTSVQGQVNLIVSRPQFGNLRATPDGLVMSGSGGPANASYYLLMATNLATPLNAWTRMATNQFDAGGNFNFTNPRDPIRRPRKERGVGRRQSRFAASTASKPMSSAGGMMGSGSGSHRPLL